LSGANRSPSRTERDRGFHGLDAAPDPQRDLARAGGDGIGEVGQGADVTVAGAHEEVTSPQAAGLGGSAGLHVAIGIALVSAPAALLVSGLVAVYYVYEHTPAAGPDHAPTDPTPTTLRAKSAK
jgi:hypothetical protein